MVPMISGVVVEGDLQNGPKVGVNNRGDSHLIIWDVDNNIAAIERCIALMEGAKTAGDVRAAIGSFRQLLSPLE